MTKNFEFWAAVDETRRGGGGCGWWGSWGNHIYIHFLVHFLLVLSANSFEMKYRYLFCSWNERQTPKQKEQNNKEKQSFYIIYNKLERSAAGRNRQIKRRGKVENLNLVVLRESGFNLMMIWFLVFFAEARAISDRGRCQAIGSSTSGGRFGGVGETRVHQRHDGTDGGSPLLISVFSAAAWTPHFRYLVEILRWQLLKGSASLDRTGPDFSKYYRVGPVITNYKVRTDPNRPNLYQNQPEPARSEVGERAAICFACRRQISLSLSLSGGIAAGRRSSCLSSGRKSSKKGELNCSTKLTCSIGSLGVEMGKKQHSKDRMFITKTEWATEWGGAKSKETGTPFKRLPFYCCS